MTRTQKILLGIGIGLVSILFISLLFRGVFFTFIDNTEYGYKFDAISGEIVELVNPDGTPKQGYIFAWPIVERVHTIDVRPMQVCINANSRVLNCKLVEFDPKGFKTLISWHGRQDYSGLMFEQIMMSYAYDPSSKSYPFLKISKELKNENINETIDTTSVETLDTLSVK
jgi:hypothetical protein